MNIEYFLGTLVIACFAAYFFYRNGVKTRQATAAAEFRKAIDSNCTIGLYNALQVAEFRIIFTNHKEAVRIFRGHLCGFSKSSFDNAWNEYEDWSNKILAESAHKQDGVYALTLAYEGKKIKQEFNVHLENLLKFSGKV